MRTLRFARRCRPVDARLFLQDLLRVGRACGGLRLLFCRAAFEHVLAAISMRFINARSQNIDAEIVRTLADMGNCTGIDRAYFVLSGPAPRLLPRGP